MGKTYQKIAFVARRLGYAPDSAERSATPQRVTPTIAVDRESLGGSSDARKQSRQATPKRPRGDPKSVKASATSSRSFNTIRESPKLSPTVRKIGKSLNDIVKTTTESTLVPQPNQETDEEAKARRRNSWGSGIPKLKEKLAGRASSNAKVVADKGRAANTIVAALTPRSIRRTGSNRVAPAPTGNHQKADTKRSSASQTVSGLDTSQDPTKGQS
ncbi:kinesin-like protein KIF12 [Ixodes scapularis]